ncbi:MAG: Ig-like domain-containing protein [Clostridia bacterium]
MDAPTALAATRMKTDGGTDGTIAGVSAQMEYRKAPEKAWTTCAEGAQIHLAKDAYEVRVKGAGMVLASAPASLLVLPPAEKATQPVAVGHVLSPVTVPDDAENSEALEAAVLDAAEKKSIAAGSATIAIAMTAAEAPVAADVHEALCASLAGGAVPAADTYLKFHVSKAIRTGETTEERPVTRLSSPFALTLGAPPALRGRGYAFGVAQVVEASLVPGTQAKQTTVGARLASTAADTQAKQTVVGARMASTAADTQAKQTVVGARMGGKARSTRLSLQPLAVKRASDAEVTVILPKDTAIPVTLVLIYKPKSGGSGGVGGDVGTPEPSETFVIVATAGAHGAIAPAGEVVVRKGAAQRFEIAADAGYEIDWVTVDGAKATLDARNHYAFESVEAPHAIHATFKAQSGEPDAPDIPDAQVGLELALLKGKKVTLSALTNLAGTWTIDRPEIAVIGKKGVLTAKKLGDALLTFTARVAGDCAPLLARPVAAGDVLALKLHVVKKGRAVTGFGLSVKALLLAPEQSAALAPKLKPATAQDKRVYFSSLDSRVATVDAQGVVTAVAPGKTAIRAIATNGQVKTIPIVVSDKPISLKLSAKKKVVRVGKTVQLTAQLAPAGLHAGDVVWRSSNESVATVDASGRVTALKPGATTIFATHPATALTAKCKLKVKARK